MEAKTLRAISREVCTHHLPTFTGDEHVQVFLPALWEFDGS